MFGMGTGGTSQLSSQDLERKTRFELATLALARRCSTAELLPHVQSRLECLSTLYEFSIVITACQLLFHGCIIVVEQQASLAATYI